MSHTVAIQYPPVMLLVTLLKTLELNVTPQKYMVALKVFFFSSLSLAKRKPTPGEMFGTC